MIKIIFVSLYVMIIGTNCNASFVDPDMDFTPPKYVAEMPEKKADKDFVYQGSIFGRGDNPLFADHKAMHVNDIVTVLISEAVKSSNTGSKAMSSSDNSNLGGGVFTTGNGATSTVAQFEKQINGLTDIKFNSASTSSFSGKGSDTKNATFNTTVSARVVKVLENGNYFIAGKREILIDNEKQVVQVSGVIRPYDISQNNQISSSQISDAKILYQTEGDINRATKQKWGTKIIQNVWPF
ncbi:flagellar basal body L-ring protein FlgH [bacterium]|nr:flagellar basal body L-ring protein FlgH [bacterium]MBU1883672.1 flagellar basal body L-ring protein FlgH [bacterium]